MVIDGDEVGDEITAGVCVDIAVGLGSSVLVAVGDELTGGLPGRVFVAVGEEVPVGLADILVPEGVEVNT